MTTDVTAKDFNPSNNELVDEIKSAANEFAAVLEKLPNTSARRKAIARTNIETASMFAVKAVFYNDDDKRTDA